MSEEKKPQPGEWWRMRNGEIAFVGWVCDLETENYPVVGRDRNKLRWWNTDGLFYCDNTSSFDLVTHLPNCTGFDYVEPPKEPKVVPWRHQFDVVRVAMRRAVESFGGKDKVFNGAGFGVQLMKLANLQGSIDGNLVEAILCGRTDVEQLSGGSHYRLIEKKQVNQ